ncbi:MAG: TlpA family protein disulfide reductase, partial [Planctomycetes bacterium]|nr:TlpA family protein disulfide reductase [Planctomycetota bacterium]
MLRSSTPYWLIAIAALASVLWATGVAPADVAQADPEVAEPEETTGEEPADPPVSRYVVPDGSPEELLAFVRDLMIDRWPSREERVTEAKRAIRDAADKILAANPTESQAKTAVKVKMFALETQAEYVRLVEDLKRMGRDELAKKVADHVVEIGQELRCEAFEKELESLAGKDAEDVEARLEKLIEEATGMLSDGKPNDKEVELAVASARLAEKIGHTDRALDAYRKYIDVLGQHEDAFGKQVASMQRIVRWLDLPGSELRLEGTLLDGTPLDWSQYHGKVVLVDFWATWCGPCLAEMPNVRTCYESYHDMGFEVIGVSLDKDREALEEYLAKEKIPWTIVNDQETRNPTADYYGITGIPTLILVGRDGKVISTKARGAELRKELAKIFGPLKEEEPEAQETSR